MAGGFLHLQPVQVCSYRSMLYVWSAELLPRISDARFCAYCRSLHHCGWSRWCRGVRGYYDVQQQAWSIEHGFWIVHHYRANTQLRWRHGAARKFKECDHGAMGMQAEVIGPMQIRIGSRLVGLWSLGQSAADGLTSTSFKSF